MGWAAAASVVLAGAVIAGPGPEWIRQALGPDDGEEPVATAGQRDATSFSHPGPELVIHFDRADWARRLNVRRTTDSLVTIRTPGPGTELTVRPEGITLSEGEAGAADYSIEIPPVIVELVLRVVGRPDRRIPTGPNDEPRVLEIDPDGNP